jgi:hypothetical protein
MAPAGWRALRCLAQVLRTCGPSHGWGALGWPAGLVCECHTPVLEANHPHGGGPKKLRICGGTQSAGLGCSHGAQLAPLGIWGAHSGARGQLMLCASVAV